MKRRIRTSRFDDATLDSTLDLENKTFEIVMIGQSEDAADRLEALARQFAQDGNIRDAMIVLRSRGYALWLEIDAATLQYLIRETT